MSHFLIALILLLSCSLAVAGNLPVRDEYRCDCVEVNHYYSDECRLVFVQLIFWDHAPERVQGWVMRDKAVIGDGRVYLHNGKTVRFERLEVTHTQHDRELENRELYPVDARRIR